MMGTLIDADARHGDELKPCPFCGSEGRITAKPDESWLVECSYNSCPASYMIGWWYDTIEEAINFWNTRYDNGKLVDADALKKKISISHSMIEDSGIKTGYEISMRLIEEQPEAVIRCKDCKYCKVYDDIPWCDRLTGTFRVEEESFCSFGKRRTDDR